MRKIQEASYLLFLLSNAAFGEEMSLQINERDVNLSPISRSMCLIANEVFKVEIPFTADLGTYHFLKRQTRSSVLFKSFEPYIRSNYNRKEHIRYVFLNVTYNNLSELGTILRRVAIYTGRDYAELKYQYEKFLVKHLIRNELQAHEQLIFFNRVNYRDFLMPQFECCQ
ncbi:hypothetical protein PPSC2_26745 (plasmid) [Paenibacillus polymyxa SC2]|uniref:Uncharacterized protein n=1 Tax=Paenibacillus polymyxa (strain SC2) TaxID=886882 RepID=A0A0D5ZCS7_PAEPS|nr:hypothetical protein PPSC2_26745 [Paenibacillus polymyxa SC2]